jgi:hypothetical protein
VKSSDGAAFGIAASIALLAGFLTASGDRVPPRRTSRPPLLATGAVSRPTPMTREARAAEDRRAWAAGVFGARRPAFADGVVVHLRTEAEGPPPSDDQGPLAHWILDRDGGLAATPRYRAQLPATPPGIPAEDAARALHLVILSADRVAPTRDARAREFWSSAADLFGGASVRFAFEIPKATVAVPAELDVSAFVGTVATSRRGRR